MSSAALPAIPLSLRHVLESGQGVLFVGAGIGYSCARPDGAPMPDARQLAGELASEFAIDAASDPDLPKVAQVVELRKGRAALNSFLSERLAGFEPNDSLKWLLNLPWKSIFTTNYDRVLQRCFELNPTPPRQCVTMSSTAGIVPFDPRFDIPIYHLHGCLFEIENPHVLITEEDYAQFRERRRMLFEILKRDWATSNLVYVGYSNRDPNWKTVQTELRQEFAPSKPPGSYRVAKSTDALDKEILASQGITTVDATVDDFVASAIALIGKVVQDPTTLDKAKSSIPSALHPAFVRNPVATLRLLNSWEYVNQAAFTATPNTAAFLNGDRPNWAVIAGEHSFHRDVEEDLIDAVLDFATSPKPQSDQTIALAPAGYGITTCLMRLAVELVKANATAVFMHRTGSPILEGDLEFACSISPTPPVFIIDNAADCAMAIKRTGMHLRHVRKPHLFLLGERLNEWRLAPAHFKAHEYFIDPLSDIEIERLLKFLEQHNALNKLLDLSHELRVAAIRQKNDRQLLVAMKEATEGPAFTAIIEDEFRNITMPEAQRLYAIVACAYQLRHRVRDGLLASLAGRGVVDMYKLVRDALEGVVEFDCTDAARGLYAARCRHHVIAEIVWERCVLAGERDQIFRDLVQQLNLNFLEDARLFESLIRDDRLVDHLTSLESKIEFFENACKKDPSSPYIKQHYARMLQREEKLDLALGQIEAAIQSSPGVRVLYHTKGVVLRDMALKNPSIAVARKRLAQAEQALRESLARDKRDTYAYQSLAELYLGWAQRCDDSVEQSAYLAKCEETIGLGLRSARQREDLWVISAKVSDWIGNEPEAIDALKKARGSPVARYLLGRAYLRMGMCKEARDVLEGIVSADPNEYRAAILYARSLVSTGESYGRGVAALRLSELYGMRDPQYVATLGGMLFLDKKFDESAKVFEHRHGAVIPEEERRAARYCPHASLDSTKPLRLNGQVVSLKGGYGWLSVSGMPNIFTLARKVVGSPLRKGDQVSFQLCFNGRGPIAEKLGTADNDPA